MKLASRMEKISIRDVITGNMFQEIFRKSVPEALTFLGMDENIDTSRDCVGAVDLDIWHFENKITGMELQTGSLSRQTEFKIGNRYIVVFDEIEPTEDFQIAMNYFIENKFDFEFSDMTLPSLGDNTELNDVAFSCLFQNFLEFKFHFLDKNFYLHTIWMNEFPIMRRSNANKYRKEIKNRYFR